MSYSKSLPPFTFDVLCCLNRDQLERFSIVCSPLKNFIDRYFHSKPCRVFDELEIRGGSYDLFNKDVQWHPNRYYAIFFIAGQKTDSPHNRYYSFSEMRPYLGPTIRIKSTTIHVDGDSTYVPEHIKEMESIAYLWRDGDIHIENYRDRLNFQPILNSPTILQCRILSMIDAHFSFKDYKIFLFSYYWVFDMDKCKTLHREFRRDDGSSIWDETMSNWKSLCREIPMLYFIANPVRIGGQGKIVEIDETFISHAKYHRGRNLDKPTERTNTIVFGGIERGTSNMFLVPVPDVRKDTLWRYIDQFILPGSHIMSDGLSSYGGLENFDRHAFQHDVVLHKYYFVDPEDSTIHTNSIESTWQKFKQDMIKSKYGTKEELFASYINEFIWKKKFVEDRLYYFWKIIYMLYFR